MDRKLSHGRMINPSEWTMGPVNPKQDANQADVRCFVAIELDDPLRLALSRTVDCLRETQAKVSWVRSENLHLTLVFLGSIPTERLPAVQEIMTRAATATAPFVLEVIGAGTFGGTRAPRIVWAGVPNPPAEVLALQSALTDCLRDKGFSVDGRRFSPHVTLGRVRGSNRVVELTSAVASVHTMRFGSLAVRHIALMQSHMNADGVRYAKVHESSLEGAEGHGS